MKHSQNIYKNMIVIYLNIFIMMFLLQTSSVLAQGDNEPLWRKSAGSLTIFQPGDAVRIQVWELNQQQTNVNLNGDYPIGPEGTIIMPLVGELNVKGLTVYELIQTIQAKLKDYMTNPLVNVYPLIRLTLQGAFIRPGAYRVPPTSSLWDVIALAGGPRGDCDLQNLQVERGGKVILEKLLNSFEKGYSIEDIGIESGDQIMAPTRNRLSVGTIIGSINLIMTLILLYLRIRYRTYY